MAYQAGKFKKYTHSPFDFEWNGVRATVDKDGRIVIVQEHDDDTFDEIKTGPSFIYRLASMLSATKRITWVDTPPRFDEVVDEEDEGKIGP